MALWRFVAPQWKLAKEKDRVSSLILFFCTIGPALLIFRLDTFTSLDFKNHHPHYAELLGADLYVSLTLTAIGVVLLGFRLYLALPHNLGEWVDKVLPDAAAPHPHSFAEASDLPHLHKEYEGYFKQHAPRLEIMEQWHRKCPHVFMLIHRECRDESLSIQRELVGSFKVLPLNKRGVRALRRGEATGSTFREGDICGQMGRANAYYVGDLYARDYASKAAILQLLDNMFLHYPNTTIYARAMSSPGQRVMTNRGFVRVSDGSPDFELGELCVREGAAKHG